MTPLETTIRDIIAREGPIPISRYMELCLSDPTHGYYMTRDPLGVAGDFITAPEISQMFGELIGLWAAAVWQTYPARAELHLIELGPGRGTLMADMLRVARIVPGFADALRVHLVETSPALRRQQQAVLAAFDVPITWHDGVDDLPWAPFVVIANEFFDALPIEQAVKVPGGWRRRCIGIDGDHLAFTLDPEIIWCDEEKLPPPLRAAAPGAVLEWRSEAIPRHLARRASAFGTVLVIDYGYAGSAIGDTLQAVANHRFVDPLDRPGEADLTAHVDFSALRRAATSEGAASENAVVYGPLTQGAFLRRLGIEERARKLKAGGRAEQAATIDAALARLTEGGPTGMGELFKVMAIAHPAIPPPPGFEPAEAAA